MLTRTFIRKLVYNKSIVAQWGNTCRHKDYCQFTGGNKLFSFLVLASSDGTKVKVKALNTHYSLKFRRTTENGDGDFSSVYFDILFAFRCISHIAGYAEGVLFSSPLSVHSSRYCMSNVETLSYILYLVTKVTKYNKYIFIN